MGCACSLLQGDQCPAGATGTASTRQGPGAIICQTWGFELVLVVLIININQPCAAVWFLPQAVTDTNLKSNLRLQVFFAKIRERSGRGGGTEPFPGFLLVQLKAAHVHTLIALTGLQPKSEDRAALTH